MKSYLNLKIKTLKIKRFIMLGNLEMKSIKNCNTLCQDLPEFGERGKTNIFSEPMGAGKGRLGLPKFGDCGKNIFDDPKPFKF